MSEIVQKREDDEAVLAAWFDVFLDDVLEGRFTDIDALIEQRPDLADRIRETQILAHRLAGRRLPTTPQIEGYEIVRELGRGGMGAVFLAHRVDSDRLVALKVLPSSFGLSDRARTRFLQEAQALAQVSSEHIVRIHNVIANDEALAFEMEYVDGPSLREVTDRLRGRGRDATLSDVVAILGEGCARLPERTLQQWFVRIVATMARALAAVHRAGLVHRDVKPSNILLRRDSTPLLADFGLVRDLASSATRTDAFVGTLHYAAPEQIRADSEACDARSDVYSLAATLWDLVVGTPPVQARSAIEALQQIEMNGAPRLRRFVEDAPRDLETILEKALDPDPAARYPTADALADDLELLLRWRPIHARPPGTIRRLGRRWRRHRRTLTAAGVGAILLASAAAIPMWLAHARQSKTARAEALVRTAHESLISRSIRDRAYREIVLGNRPEYEQVRQLSGASESGIETSLRALDEAAALEPGRVDIASEDLLVAIGGGVQRSFDLAILSPAVRSYATPWATGRLENGLKPFDFDGTTIADRHAIGLIAFLAGDVANCDVAWSALDPVDAHAPLTDAGLGLLYAIDDRPERAYPRLLQALRTFPDNPLLATTLAEVGVELGDPDLAERWLLRAGQLHADPFDLGIARADLQRARGDRDGCRTSLNALDAGEPRVALRLAQLERETGDLLASKRRLQALVERFPGMLRARAELARTAIVRRDRSTYLHEVEWVVDHDIKGLRSPGTARVAIEMLRDGGLHALAEQLFPALASSPARGGWVDAAATRPLFGDPRWIETLVLRRRDLRRDLASGFPRPASSEDVARAAELLARAVATWSAFPELGAACPPSTHLLASTAALAIRIAWNDIVRTLLPRLLGGPATFAKVEAHAVHTTDGPTAGELLGAVAPAGDIDGDGIADLLCGSLRAPEDGPGSVLVVSGADGSILQSITGIAVGQSIAAIGDLDHDGHGDFAHVEMLPHPDGTAEPVVHLRSGRDGHLLQTLHDEESSSTFGSVMVSPGDVDGDRVPDLAVGSMGEIRGIGFVAVYSGADGKRIVITRGPKGASFGVAITTIRDSDGDGVRDLLVGGLGADRARGKVWLLSSRTGAELGTVSGDADTMLFGEALASGVDLDQDGDEDFAVGAVSSRRVGSITLISGADLHVIRVLRTAEGGQSLGETVALGDLDGDGIPDVVAGDRSSNLNGPRAGRVVAWSGRSLAQGSDPVVLFDLRGSEPAWELGTRVALLENAFGPGHAALLVGAPGRSTNAPATGSVWQLSPILPIEDARRGIAKRR